MKDCENRGCGRTDFWAEATGEESMTFFSPSSGSCIVRIQEEITKSCFSPSKVQMGLTLPEHPSNFCNSQGKAMSAIFGGFIPTQKGLTQLHSTLALWPRKRVEIQYKCIGLPGQWLGNSQKKVCPYSRHSHHSSDLPQVFSEKQPYWRNPRNSLCCQSSSRTQTSQSCCRQPWWPMCFSGWAAMSRRGPHWCVQAQDIWKITE